MADDNLTDDGLDSGVFSGEDEDEYLHGGPAYHDGNTEGEEEPPTKRWKVDHSSGHHKFRVPQFVQRVLGSGFEPSDALDMLQQKHTIDFGSKNAGSAQAKPTDGFFPEFFLDFLSIVGKPGRPISSDDGPIFDNVTISFQRWAKPYGAKHVSGIPFDITGRTFRIAQAATREVWFIVMHPMSGEVTELPRSAADRRRRREQAGENSGLPKPLAQKLATYITRVFRSAELLGEGVEDSWYPGGPHSQRITTTKWTIFQKQFMDGWAAWAGTHDPGSFWCSHEPAFHAYDYGANIQIEVSDWLFHLPRERPYTHDDEEEDEDEEDEDQAIVDIARRQAAGVFVEDNGRAAVEENAANYNRILQESAGLQKLVQELNDRFRLDNIAVVSYALAVCINSDSDGKPRCLLVDRNMMAREYPSPRDFTFYPQAFNPVYGNVSSSRPPEFLAPLFATMKGNMSDRNEGADVLSFGYFQGYSNIKRSVRHSPQDLLATKGYATAALTVPASDACSMSATRDKRERLLRLIRGQGTPFSPDASTPFARSRVQMQYAIDTSEVAYRLEQVVSLDLGRMVGAERKFETVIHTIFQIIRFFLVEVESYVHIFRSMPTDVFPKIMCAYSRIFELALGEMERRFTHGGERGLDLPHSEAVAVMDRLGGYIFTGHDRHLPKTVLRPLGTIDSLRNGAWPYIDPALLDMRSSGGAVIHIGKWPRTKKGGRPVLLHVGELRFHYGERISANRESDLWFAQLGETAFSSVMAVTGFVDELVRDLWVPQTKSFITQQLRRRLHEGGETDGRPITSDVIRQCQTAIEAWQDAKDAFTNVALVRLTKGLEAGGSRVAITESTTRTRHDFAVELIRAIATNKGKDAFSSKNASWPLKLHLAIASGHKADGGIGRSEWASVLTACLLTERIEWLPGSIRGRLTSRNIIHLSGATAVLPKMSGPPGSLRRAAQEAELAYEEAARRRAHQAANKLNIDFGCDFPIISIPDLLQSGLDQAKSVFTRADGDRKVLDHYQLVMNCLAENIDDPLCQLMLMLTLTVCSSSATPQVDVGAKAFSVSPKRKDPGQLALAMVTRMMWFLYRQSFPWDKGSGSTAHDVAEMTKKIGM
ncbi:hypothetical protein COL26b_014121 [Colletotrichum chrysophilum]|uniref:uncharacterized protein n=1 Tax=Colletotrichum chrysophilum TaxID=1836956 RepID=UPI002300619C|nr:uncharacterized protein COL26b_014121 [Colletotrichum chrysophilum]KAJ0360294.1 hypothetical protein COL26b_014121 [Colletotrichum chrysophilum]